MPKTTFKATAHLQDGMKVIAKARNFQLTIDEPESLGGTNQGMNPVEVLLGAYGACQSIVARSYAEKFDIELEDFWIELEGDLDTDGLMNVSNVRPGFSDIRFNIHIKTNASKDKVNEFISFVEKRCPVGDTIGNEVNLTLNQIIIG